MNINKDCINKLGKQNKNVIFNGLTIVYCYLLDRVMYLSICVHWDIMHSRVSIYLSVNSMELQDTLRFYKFIYYFSKQNGHNMFL